MSTSGAFTCGNTVTDVVVVPTAASGGGVSGVTADADPANVQKLHRAEGVGFEPTMGVTP
jgi:hypothetical protein